MIAQLPNMGSSAPETRIRYPLLLTLSLVFAIILEVNPAEVGFLYGYVIERDALGIACVKLTCLHIIFLPLATFLHLNRQNLRVVLRLRRTRAVFAIVAIRLLMDVFLILFRWH